MANAPTGDTVAVSVSDDTNLEVDPTTLIKNTELKNQELTLSVKDGVSGKAVSTEITSITVNGAKLTATTDYTYVSGVITFNSNTTATTSGAVVINAMTANASGMNG